MIFPNTDKGNAASKAYVARLTSSIMKGSVPNDVNVSIQTVADQVRALLLWDNDNAIFEQLSNLKMQVLIAGGLDDELDHPQNVETIAKQIPFAWTAYFAGAGHYFASQEYEKVAHLIDLFLSSVVNH